MAWRNLHAPHVKVPMPRLGPQDWVSDLTVYQVENGHQIAELTVMQVYNPELPSQRWRTPAGSMWPDNTPVHVQWGWWADESADFYGYVASSRVIASEGDQRYGYAVQVPVRYTLIGASMPMQTRKNRVWVDTTLSAVARQIAREYNLQPQVQRSSVRYATQMQAASDWQFLAELTERVGYRLYVDATTLWFVDRATAMPTNDRSVPQFRSQKTPGVIDSLREFSVIVGDTDPAGGVRARYQTLALNKNSGILTPAAYTQPRSVVPHGPVPVALSRQFDERPSVSYAKAEVNMSSSIEWLWVQANAVTNGDPRLRPGGLVNLQGRGLADGHTGQWMVRTAIHRITPNHIYRTKSTYTCELVLGRNQPDRLDLPVQTEPPRYAATRLVGGKWRAEFTPERL